LSPGRFVVAEKQVVFEKIVGIHSGANVRIFSQRRAGRHYIQEDFRFSPDDKTE